jgi:hypothetical protein
MNDLLVCERPATATPGNTLVLTRKNVLPPIFWGSSGRRFKSCQPDHVKVVFDLLFSVAETAIKVELLFVWDHVLGCEAFFRTCPMVK